MLVPGGRFSGLARCGTSAGGAASAATGTAAGDAGVPGWAGAAAGTKGAGPTGAGATTGWAGGDAETGPGRTGATTAGGAGGGSGTPGSACAVVAPASSAARAPRPAAATVAAFTSMSIFTQAPFLKLTRNRSTECFSLIVKIVTPGSQVNNRSRMDRLWEHVLLRSICNRPQRAPSVV